MSVQLPLLRIARLRTRQLLRLLLRIDFRRCWRLARLRVSFGQMQLRKFVRPMRLRVTGLQDLLLLLLRLLLLPLLLLLNRGPAQPDTTRATRQSTEGRGVSCWDCCC